MGVTINGAGSSNAQGVMAGTLTIKNKNAQAVSFRTIRKKSVKQLNYNHREISGQLLRAKKARSASSVLTRAKSKVSALQRCSASGQYDSKDVAMALAHAKRMVRCAQMKVRNLREEEREQASHRNEGEAKARQKKSEIKRRVAQKEEKVKQKIQIETTQEVLKEKRKRQEMMQKRNFHRAQERGKVMEADMKYLQALSDEGRVPYTGNAPLESGVMMELSAEAAALMMTEAEIEAQVQQELEAEMGTAGFEMSVDAAVSATAMTSSVSVAQSVGAAVDISI